MSTTITVSSIGLGLALLGLLTAAGSAWFPAELAAWLPQLRYMAPNTATGFVLAGATLAWPTTAGARAAAIRTTAGVALVALGAVALLQVESGWYAPAPAWRYVANVDADSRLAARWPSFMVPLTAIEFMICGAALALTDRLRRAWAGLLLQLALCGVILLAAPSTVSFFLEHALYYKNTSDYGMANPVSAAGMILLAAGLLLATRRTEWSRRLYRGREDRQVFALSAMLIVAAVLLAGVTVSGILVRSHVASFKETLKLAHRANSLLFRNSIESAALQATDAVEESALAAILAWGDDAPPALLRNELDRLIVSGGGSRLASVVVYDAAGQEIASAGPMDDETELRVPISRTDGAWLLWRAGWLLEKRLHLTYQGRRVGEVLVHAPLNHLQSQFDYTHGFGRTGEVLACVEEKGDRAACFPSRLAPRAHRESIFYQGELIPMGLALTGQHGVTVARDYRGILVVAAYGRIADTPLGLVQKIDIDDLSQSVRTRLWQVLPLLLLVSVAGALLLARIVRPIVFDLVASKERLRWLSARNEAVREEERKRIAREMHDVLGQELTALRMELALLRLDLPSESEAVKARLQSMTGLIDSTIKTARHVTSSLRPPAIDLGITAALEWLAMEFAERTGIACHFDASDDDIPLQEASAIALFRIAQEALTNVARHAQASAASVSLERDGGRIRLEIRDNGIGFDPEQAKKRDSFGLVGIHERAHMLRGTARIDSSQGKGATIAIEIADEARQADSQDSVGTPA